MSELARTSSTSTDLDTFGGFENALLSALERAGLPSDGVLVGVDQRHRVFQNFGGAIERLDEERRGRSLYLSKMLAAVGAGLFDAALNYLWDETVSELRRRIALYDVAYFFDIAVSSPDRRKRLKDASDLDQLSDQVLIRASSDIGLISDVGFQQLDLIRYMRNYASAAHPNHHEVEAYQILGWVETCIKEVVMLPESQLVAETKRLLTNVRNGSISAGNAAATAEFFSDLSGEGADNLVAGLFGIYVDPGTDESARGGVRLLTPSLWTHVSDRQRHSLGVKHATHVANGDTGRAERAREVLEVVGGAAYLTDKVRSVDLDVAIGDLLSAHRGHSNFHAEPGPARRLNSLTVEPVPEGVRESFVSAVVEVFLTNGNGVSWAADEHYASMISRFGPREAEIALLQLFGQEISSKLRWESARLKFADLMSMLDSKVATPAARELLDGIDAFTASPDSISSDSGLARLADRLR